MTEQQWLTSTDPAAMLRYLAQEFIHACGGVPGRWVDRDTPLISNRKLRLWVEACRAIAKDAGVYNLNTQLDTAAQHWARIDCPGSRVSLSLRAALLRDIVGNSW